MTTNSLLKNTFFANLFFSESVKRSKKAVFDDTNELANILWDSTSSSQKILLDNLFKKLTGKSFKSFVNTTDISDVQNNLFCNM